ncbi:MAG: efflux RND transporter periplasmic adaptor subunit [Candidatus Sumerlaeota bacterium]|nr:efflux RND transporter periplasmic adaptor subunit [Candidatus Sumerlaeota bacterium]
MSGKTPSEENAREMTTLRPAPRKPARRRRWVIAAIGILVLAAAAFAGYWAYFRKSASFGINLKTAARCRVMRGRMTITSLQSGELAAKKERSIKNETEREAKIINIVDDGATVTSGDVLVELDATEVKDSLRKSQSFAAQAEADYNQAKTQAELDQVKNAADVEAAVLKKSLGELDLKKYQEAEFPQQVRKAKMDITLSEADLKRAETTLEKTQKMVDRGYANRQDLEVAQLAKQKSEIELENNRANLSMLTDYTSIKDLKEKQKAVNDATAEIARLKKTGETERKRAEVNIQSKKVQMEIAQTEVKKVQERVDKATIRADFNGRVFYPDTPYWRSDQKIEKHAKVYFQQQILVFPDTSAWQIKTAVPEATIKRIKPGQEAVVAIDAVPNEVHKARVARISFAPQQDNWGDDRGVRKYSVMMDLLTTPSVDLKPGMSAMMEIVLEQIPDAIYVPLQAVTDRGDMQYAYRIQGGAVKQIEVRTGASDEHNVQIIEGLNEGDHLLLYAPVEAEIATGMKERPTDKARKQGEKAARDKKESGEKKESDDMTTKAGQGDGKAAKDAADSPAIKSSATSASAATAGEASPPAPAGVEQP